MKRLLLIVLCLSLSACAPAQIIKYQTHMDLFPGLTKQRVLEDMGPPAIRELYRKKDTTLVEFYIYKSFEPYENLTPICFINNKVVGWGNTFYQDHVSSDDLRLK